MFSTPGHNSLLAATAFTDDLCPLIQAVFVGDFPGIQPNPPLEFFSLVEKLYNF